MLFKSVKPNKCILFCKLSLQILSRNINASQVSSAGDSKYYINDSHNYFATKLGRRVRKVLVKVNQKHIESVTAVLKKHYIDTSNLHDKSRIFHDTPWGIEQKIMLLEELGAVNITTEFLLDFRRRLRLPVKIFKEYLPLHHDKPLAENLFAYLNNCNINPQEIGLNEDQVAKYYLHRCFVYYFKEKLELNQDQVNRLKNTKNNVFSVPSFRLFSKVLEILQNDIRLPNKKIMQHYFTLLSLHPDQLQTIYNIVGEVAKDRTRLIALQYPPMFDHNVEDLKLITSFLKKHVNYPEKISATRLIGILRITSYELKRRYDYFSKNYYTRNLLKHPKFVNLIPKYYRVLPRIRYLEEQNLQYATLHSLTTYFKNYHEDFLTLKTLNIYDMISFFQVNFGNDADEAMQTFKKHVYYKYVPLNSMRKSLDYLREKFPVDIIKKHSYAILYNQIDLQAAYEVVTKNADYRTLPPNQLLTMCLYKIELNNHFTGDPVLAPGKYAESLKENVDEAERFSNTKES